MISTLFKTGAMTDFERINLSRDNKVTFQLDRFVYTADFAKNCTVTVAGVVGVVTRLRAGRQKNRGLIHVTSNRLSVLRNVHTGLLLNAYQWSFPQG